MKSERKHILILSSWYPTPEHPFLGNFVQRQALLLSQYYQISVIHTLPEEDRKTNEVRLIENDSFKEFLIYHPKGSHFLSRRKNRLKALSEGMKLIDRPDLIHGHILVPGGYIFVKAKEFFKCRLVVTEHASYYRPGRKEKLSFKEKYVLQLIRKNADRIIAVSDFLKKDMRNIFGERIIDVIGNPVDTELFIPAFESNNNGYFLHVSTLDPSLKNVRGILEAISLLVQKGYEETRLIIISDEPWHDWIETVSLMGLNRYVDFRGPLQPNELAPFFQQAAALVMFSHYETFSIVMSEAWACGVPVLSTPVGIAAEMTNEHGLKVKDNDPLSLAMAMEKILNDHPFSKETIRKKGLEFSDHNFITAIRTVYDELF